MSKTLGLNVSIYISSLAQKAKSIQIHPPYTRLPSPDYFIYPFRNFKNFFEFPIKKYLEKRSFKMYKCITCTVKKGRIKNKI